VSAVPSIAVIGETARVRGFALAGATVCPADDAERVRTAWDALTDAALVVLTPTAATTLADRLDDGPLVAVMPP